MKIFRIPSRQFWFAVILISVPLMAHAGNKRMVEHSVKELEDLNAKALSQVDVPKDGHISIKGDVRYVNGVPEVHVVEHKVSQMDGNIRLPQLSTNKPTKSANSYESANHSKGKAKLAESKLKQPRRDGENVIMPVFHIQAQRALDVKTEFFNTGSRYIVSHYDKSGWQLAAPIREEELHVPIITP